MENWIGKKFAGLEVVEEIARGGMGIVYKARQVEMNRFVALKIILPELTSARQIKRFLREAEATSSLQHSNIVAVYQMGKENDLLYFTMQYIEGKTLEDFFQGRSFTELLPCLIKICHAMDYAHSKQIIHRDLKPSNILVDASGEPFVVDFGLAKVLSPDVKSRLTQTGTTIGTPLYMSPEQLLGKSDVNHSTDIYSLGVMLYEILTETKPFEGKSLSELCQKICHSSPTSPQQLNPKIPTDLENICLKAIEKKTRHRYQSAQEMAKDLEAFISGQPVSVAKKTWGSTLRYWQGQNRILATILMFMSLAALLLSSSWLTYQHFSKATNEQQVKQKLYLHKVLEASRKYQKQKQWSTALKLLKIGIQKQPNSLPLYYELANIYFYQSKIQEAKTVWEKVYKRNPNSSEIIWQRGIFHYQIGEFNTALRLTNKYIQQNKHQENGYRQRAAIYQQLERPFYQDLQHANKIIATKIKNQITQIKQLATHSKEEALTKIAQVKQQYPTYSKIYQLEAHIHQQSANITQALQSISQAIQLDPQLEFFITKAKLLITENKWQETWEVLAKAPKEKSSNYDYWILFGTTALQLNNNSSALKGFQQALPLTNNKVFIHLQIAKTYYQAKNFHDVFTYLHEPLLSKGNQQIVAEANFYLGMTHLHLQETKLALQSLLKATKYSFPSFHLAHYHIGKLYLEKNNLELAKKHLELACDNKAEGKFFFWLAKCYQRKISANSPYITKTIQAFTQAIECEPWNADYYYSRSRIYRQEKNWQAFEDDLATAIRLQPKNFNYCYELMQGLLDNTEDIFRNYQRLLWLWRVGTRSSSFHQIETPDLFFAENVEQHRKYLTSTPGKQHSWNHQQAHILLKGYLQSQNPTVQKIAFAALVEMHHSADFRQLLNEKQQTIPSWQQSKLQQLKQAVTKKYYNQVKYIFYGLILRQYASNDSQALTELFHYGEEGIYILEHILVESNSSDFMRYMAAQMLWELRTPKSHEMLLQHQDSPDYRTSLFASLALKTFSKQPLSFSDLQYFTPFTKGVLAQKLPRESSILPELLKDPDDRVRLYTAKRIPHSGRAKQIFQSYLKNPKAEFRHFALIGYYQRLLIHEYPTHFSDWKTAINDVNSQVRKVAVSILEKTLHKDVPELLFQKVLHDNDYGVRLSAISSLLTRGEEKKLIAIFSSSEMPHFLRLSIFLENPNKMPFPVSNFAPALGKVLNDSSPIMKAIIHAYLPYFFPSDTISQRVLLNKLKKTKDDYVKTGCLVGISGLRCHARGVIPQIQHFLKDKDPQVRHTAAATIMRIATETYDPKRDKWRQYFEKSPKYLRGGAAQGLKLVGADRLFRGHVDFPYWDYEFVYRVSVQRMATRFEYPYYTDVLTPYSPNDMKYEKQLILGMQKQGVLPQDRKKIQTIAANEDNLLLVNTENNKRYSAWFRHTHWKVFHLLGKPSDSIHSYKIKSHSPEFYHKLFYHLHTLVPNANNSFELGIQYYIAQNYSLAEKHIRKAIRLKNKWLFSLWLARICYLQNKNEEAWSITSQLMKENPFDYELCQLRVHILQKLGKKFLQQQESDRLSLLEPKFYKDSAYSKEDQEVIQIQGSVLNLFVYGRAIACWKHYIQDTREGYLSWISQQKMGDFLEFSFDLPKAGYYQVELDLVRLHNGGIMQIEINGKKIEKLYDFYSPNIRKETQKLVTTFLRETSNKIRFTIKGKNPVAGDGYGLGIQKLSLTKVY